MQIEFENMPDYPIYQAIMTAVDEYTGQQGNKQPRYEFYDYPQRLTVLSEMLKLHILREHGDIKKYIELQERVFSLSPGHSRKTDIGLVQIVKWLDRELDAIKIVTPEKDTVVISLLAFGDIYIQKMLDFTFKSMMAVHNLPSLVMEKKVIMYIQTDQESMEKIKASEIYTAMKAIGVLFDFALFPKEVRDELKSPDIIYWILGAAASLGLQYAKSMQAAFHHSYPDIIYSDKYFTELWRLSKDHHAVLLPGMRADEVLLNPLLTPYTTDKSLSVPSPDLMALHMNCLHAVAWPYVVNNRKRAYLYPRSHVHIWEGKDAIEINCPHLNAIWLDYTVLKDLRKRFYMTFDSELDMVCRGENYYIPQESDEIYQLDLSEPDRAALTDGYCDVLACADYMWRIVTHRDCMKFFMRGARIKINREIRPVKDNTMSSGQIVNDKRFLFNAIQSIDPYAHIQLAQSRAHVGKLF